MKAIFAAGTFLLLGVVSVLACSADYWSNGADQFQGGPCSNNYPTWVYKNSYWAVKYPLQTGYTPVNSYGAGQCMSSIPSLCWPLFYGPDTSTDNLWKQ